jgi:hypothetical protein
MTRVGFDHTPKLATYDTTFVHTTYSLHPIHHHLRHLHHPHLHPIHHPTSLPPPPPSHLPPPPSSHPPPPNPPLLSHPPPSPPSTNIFVSVFISYPSDKNNHKRGERNNEETVMVDRNIFYAHHRPHCLTLHNLPPACHKPLY